MAFVQVGAAPIIKLDKYKEGDIVIEGTYIGTFATKFNQKPAFKFQEKGGTVRALACGSLAYKMQSVEKGMLCRIIYLGKHVMPKGSAYAGRDFHDVEVLVDDTSLDVKSPTSTETEEMF